MKYVTRVPGCSDMRYLSVLVASKYPCNIFIVSFMLSLGHVFCVCFNHILQETSVPDLLDNPCL